MPPELQRYFSAAKRGDWLSVSNQFNYFLQNPASFRGMPWEPMVRETWGALYFFGAGDEKYSAAYADDVITSIPPGSIYFGGTDSGRFLITAMQKSQVNGDPFFTLTQNALADGGYLGYLRNMYGDKIYIPTAKNLEKCFQDYIEDATQRLRNNQLKPGENVTPDANGKMQVSGVVSVMEINGLLAKIIFDKNPDHEFYVEESFPLDWMYPYLEPHGLIFKLNRQPLTELSDEIVQTDHDYWTKLMTPMIGDWLNNATTISDIGAFAEKVYVKKDLNSFNGDPRFIRSSDSQKMFSKERANIADLYVWRMNHATIADESERMAQAADFAFRQALALCPNNSDAKKDYTDFLKNQNRDSDAILVSGMW